LENDAVSLLWTMMQADNQRFYGAHFMSKKGAEEAAFAG